MGDLSVGDGDGTLGLQVEGLIQDQEEDGALGHLVVDSTLGHPDIIQEAQPIVHQRMGQVGDIRHQQADHGQAVSMEGKATTRELEGLRVASILEHQEVVDPPRVASTQVFGADLCFPSSISG